MVPAQISVTIMSEDPSFLRGSNASRLIGLIDEGESARQHDESSANQSVVVACDRRDAIPGLTSDKPPTRASLSRQATHHVTNTHKFRQRGGSRQVR